MRSFIDKIFYDLIPGKQKIRLNFKLKPVNLDDKTHSGTFKLVLNDSRWFEKKIDRETYFIDSIDGNMMSASSLVESFNKGKDSVYGGKGVPIFVGDFISENKGTKTILGLQKLIKLNKFEEAFLSCNSIFLRRLRVILFFCENYEQSLEKWERWNMGKFRSAGLIIRNLEETGIIDEKNKKVLLQYCEDRNKIDHEISEGSIETKDLLHNLNQGIKLLKYLESLFVKLTTG